MEANSSLFGFFSHQRRRCELPSLGELQSPSRGPRGRLCRRPTGQNIRRPAQPGVISNGSIRWIDNRVRGVRCVSFWLTVGHTSFGDRQDMGCPTQFVFRAKLWTHWSPPSANWSACLTCKERIVGINFDRWALLHCCRGTLQLMIL